MDAEKLQAIIQGFALSQRPETRAAASQLVRREQFMLRASVIGLSDDLIARMRDLAEAVGPRTTLPNNEVWAAVWQSMLDRAARALPPIPDDDRPVQWARAIWRLMFCADPRIQEMHAFVSLVDALKRAREYFPA